MPRNQARQTKNHRHEKSGDLREERRTAIIEAAKSVFMREGLEKSSMRTIAKEAGCTTGAIYPYFDGKEEIYGAVLSESLSSLHDYIRQIIAKADGAVDRARSGLTAFHDYYRHRPDELALGLYLFQGLGPNGLNKELDGALNTQLTKVVSLLTEECAAAGLKNPKAAAGGGIAQAIGGLILERTGRIKLVELTSPDLMRAYLDRAFGVG